MGKINVDLTDDITEDENPIESLQQLTESLPSVSRAKAPSLKRAPRVVWSFTNIPAPIK